MAALNSNQPATARAGSHSSANGIINTNDLFDSPPQDFEFNEEAEYDFDLDEEADDADEDNVSPDSNGHLHDKRKSMDGKGDDDEGGGKRREGDDKTSKKPGRKPLTSEPTSVGYLDSDRGHPLTLVQKRKAQNRAAQRNFRERKEKHLKDLETKVEDLEKASDASNHENGLLRAQVERLQVELKEYRKRLSWVSSNNPARTQQSPTNYASQMKNGNTFNSDFQFEFPKFGDLPAVPSLNGNRGVAPARSSTLPSAAPNARVHSATARAALSSASPPSQSQQRSSNGSSPRYNAQSASPVSQQPPVKTHNDSIDSLTGLFSPSILEASRNPAYGYFPQTNAGVPQPGRATFDVGQASSFAAYASSSNTNSPASSSDAHHQTSSIGTSPEPSLSSPGQKQHDFSLNPISENQVSNTFGEDALCDQLQLACGCAEDPIPPMWKMSNGATIGSGLTPGFETNGINWLAQQNGGGFDPMLFGDYREPQDAGISQDFGSFFNDAFPLPDLGSPQHNFNELPTESMPKNDLLDKVDAIKDGEEVVPGEDRAKLMTCNKIWYVTPRISRHLQITDRVTGTAYNLWRNSATARSTWTTYAQNFGPRRGVLTVVQWLRRKMSKVSSPRPGERGRALELCLSLGLAVSQTAYDHVYMENQTDGKRSN